MAPWRVLLWVKVTEVVMQCRPRALYRTLFHRDRGVRWGMRWYTRIGRRVWLHEVWRFFRDRRTVGGPTVAEFWGEPQDHGENAMTVDAAEVSR
jgi:anaerobic magnesium-protoporphyrin IX monomethyl ester cyclase